MQTIFNYVHKPYHPVAIKKWVESSQCHRHMLTMQLHSGKDSRAVSIVLVQNSDNLPCDSYEKEV